MWNRYAVLHLFFTILRFATDMLSCKFLFSFRFTFLIINYLCNLEKLNFYHDEKH